MWKVGSEQQSTKMDPADPAHSAHNSRVQKYGFMYTKPYFSLWESSGGLWGRSRHILLFLRGKKAPAGALKTRIGCLGGIKSPCGSAKDENRLFGGKKTLRER